MENLGSQNDDGASGVNQVIDEHNATLFGDIEGIKPKNRLDRINFSIPIDPDTEFELRKFKQKLEKERKEPVDWNSTLKEIVKRATNINRQTEKTLKEPVKRASNEKQVRPIPTAKKEASSDTRTFPLKFATASDTRPTAVSRYIPAKIRHDLEQKYHGHCAYKNCNKPADHIHHQNRFALIRTHKNIVPLCKAHHDLIHQTSTIDQIFNKLKSEFSAASG